MISYHTQDIKFSFKGKRLHTKWISSVVQEEGYHLGDLAFIFCSDAYLLDMNKAYLAHDYYTDIITFDYTEGSKISGDLFISVDTVKANAQTYSVAFLHELRRVLVHGVLHLLGYNDSNPAEVQIMREKEDYYLSKLSQYFNES